MFYSSKTLKLNVSCLDLLATKHYIINLDRCFLRNFQNYCLFSDTV